MHHPSDHLAASAAAAERRARALRKGSNAALVEAQNQLAAISAKPLPVFDQSAAELELAQARAADEVHGTATAREVERRSAAARMAAADAARERADALAKIEPLIAERRTALAGTDVVLADAIENTRAMVSAAAKDRLPVVQAAYRAALQAAMDLATDIWALQALVVEKDRPANRAITTNAVPLTFPGLDCFGDEHLQQLREVGAQASGPAVLLNRDDAQERTLADVSRIRDELTAQPEQATA